MEGASVFFIEFIKCSFKINFAIISEHKYIISFAKLLGIVTSNQWAKLFFFQLAI